MSQHSTASGRRGKRLGLHYTANPQYKPRISEKIRKSPTRKFPNLWSSCESRVSSSPHSSGRCSRGTRNRGWSLRRGDGDGRHIRVVSEDRESNRPRRETAQRIQDHHNAVGAGVSSEHRLAGLVNKITFLIAERGQ